MRRERPRARAEGLLVRNLGEELVVYEVASHRAHSLNRTAALVWRACDGRTTVAAIAARLARELGGPVSRDLVPLALRRLRHAGLLEPASGDEGALTRRQLARRIGEVALLPVVISILAPRPSEAATCPCTAGVVCSCAGQDDGVTCWDGSDCVNNFCTGGTCSSG